MQVTFNGTLNGTFNVGDVITFDFNGGLADGNYTVATKPNSTTVTLSGTSGGFYSLNQPTSTAFIGQDINGDMTINSNLTVTNTTTTSDLIVEDSAAFNGNIHAPNIPSESTPTKVVTFDESTNAFEVSTLAEIRPDSLLRDMVIDTLITTTTTAELYNIHLADVSSGTVTINPPGSPVKGDWFAVSDAAENAATNNITVDFSLLFGIDQDYVISADGGYARFTYIDGTTGWIKSN